MPQATTFQGVQFQGTFRDYQQAVLNHAQRHLKDGKIHIVAAPGSGKTILGLELLRRLGKPALILAPSITIRQQWGERFAGSYLPQGASVEDYVSFDLTEPRLLTCITYQALHAAYTRSTLCERPDEEGADAAEEADFSGFDLARFMRETGIETVCLDEAHHLRSEWQKALEAFVAGLKDATIVALTATPPYDSTPTEWARYTALCGEIDEEIFVPQLVAQKTLCPHQDYLYFNYPSEEEAAALADYRQNAQEAVAEILQRGIITRALDACGLPEQYRQKEALIFEHTDGFLALFTLAKHGGVSLPPELCRWVSPAAPLPTCRLSHAEAACQFILDTPQVFPEMLIEELRHALAERSLIEKKKVCLCESDKLQRMLLASIGKLQSISRIVEAEHAALGDGLRLLVLTDYIKKDLTSLIGGNETIHTMGTVPIFESLRRAVPGVRLAVLSGSVILLPDEALSTVREIANARGVSCYARPLGDTGYSEVNFSGSSQNKVGIVTESFEAGCFSVLIGTKSLLGEGWDSPCINSLILASFVGSFMLSNQMRGRAIRTYRPQPDKAANIWHLVTVEPPENGDTATLAGADLATVCRRFDTFLAPTYSGDTIESGIDRVDILKPPYTREGVEALNARMLALTADRDGMAKSWERALRSADFKEILEMCELSPRVQLTAAFSAAVVNALLTAGAGVLLYVLGGLLAPVRWLCRLVGVLLLVRAATVGVHKILRHATPKRSVRTIATALLETLQEQKEIDSRSARVLVLSEKTPHGTVLLCALRGANAREQQVFAAAAAELFAAVDDPRYLLMRKGRETESFACPAVLSKKKETVERLCAHLRATSGAFIPVYARNDAGHRTLLRCRQQSYLNRNACTVRRKKRAAPKR